MQVPPLHWEDHLEAGTATHSTILALRVPQTESLAGCSPRGHTEWDTLKQLSKLVSLNC